MSRLADATARDEAVRERERNVILEASAGTGKTHVIVSRLVEMLAPRTPHRPTRIERIAAITFTRKAAGELRVRTRQRLLAALAGCHEPGRADALRDALAGIDTAQIGTIHSFADHLLRKWPAAARLDPRYELPDQSGELVEACFERIEHAVGTNALGELLAGSELAGGSDELCGTLRDAHRAGLRWRSWETEVTTYHGLDGLFASWIAQRDVPGADVDPVPFDRSELDRRVDEYRRLVAGVDGCERGARWLVETAALLARAAADPDPVEIYRQVVRPLERGPLGRASEAPRRREHFGGDDHAWRVWRALVGDETRRRLRDGALRDDLLAPLRRWMAMRLVRLRPAVLHVYERVKAEHGAVDHVDLLLQLRDLLRDHVDIRRACQDRFDHVFVDELQDTDPLQAEIVLFLCEDGASATAASEVRLRAGRLTIVGDPKQSIYRFRRADIASYRRVVDIVRRSPHREVRLTSSFRMTPELVDWIDARFATILTAGGPGDVGYDRFTYGPRSRRGAGVHAIRIAATAGANHAAHRELEASAIARYLRGLVSQRRTMIEDPITSQNRPLGYGDIAVLALTTTTLDILFRALERDGIPYAARGGAVFLDDHLHRQFLLGLCAIADPDDGVAMAAVLRPPYFALSLADVARAADAAGNPVRHATAIVAELRRLRFDRPVGTTARLLLELTGFGRAVALGPNGPQRLAGLRELCLQVEAIALLDGVDFDAAVERARRWVYRAPKLERPHPVGADAIRVMTVHQAKGLEFPVVIPWDCRATWTERVQQDAWTVDRDSDGWAIRLDGLGFEHPPGGDLVRRERAMRQAERKRLVYVAATRARDLVVLPCVVDADDRWVWSTLVVDGEGPPVTTLPVHTSAAPADWYRLAAPPERTVPTRTTDADATLARVFEEAATATTVSRTAPSTFAGRSLRGNATRFGMVFGTTVHRAIGIALRGTSAADAVARVVVAGSLPPEAVDAAIQDVARALAGLAALGIPGIPFRLEYPLAVRTAEGELAYGYADLVAADASRLLVLDFKTDDPPHDAVLPDGYVRQVAGYRGALRASSTEACVTEAGLLYTADGAIRWIPTDHDEPPT